MLIIDLKRPFYPNEVDALEVLGESPLSNLRHSWSKNVKDSLECANQGGYRDDNIIEDTISSRKTIFEALVGKANKEFITNEMVNP